MMSTMLIGNAPCSWGTLEFEGLAQQPIPYQRMLDELAETGYTGTELGDWGYLPTEPDSLASILTTRRLHLTGAFVPVALEERSQHDAGERTALRTAHLLADVARRLNQPVPPFLVLATENGLDPLRVQNAGRITPDMGLSDPQWQTRRNHPPAGPHRPGPGGSCL